MDLAIVRTVGIILFMYLVWRSLKDDYAGEDLVAYGWGAILSFLVGSRLAYGLINWGVWNSRWWDWLLFWEKSGSILVAGYLVMLWFTWWWCETKKWKTWSFLEDVSQWLLLLMGLLVLDEAWRSKWQGIGMLPIILLAVIVIKLFKGKYRSFSWYRSGKKGFLFLMANIVVWLTATIVYREWWQFVLCLLSVVGLFMLGDVLELLKINKKNRK